MQHAPGQQIQSHFIHIRQLRPGKDMGKNLIIEIKKLLAFDQDRSGGGIQIVYRVNQSARP